MLTPHPSECNPLWFAHHHCNRCKWTRCQGPQIYSTDLTSIHISPSKELPADSVLPPSADQLNDHTYYCCGKPTVHSQCTIGLPETISAPNFSDLMSNSLVYCSLDHSFYYFFIYLCCPRQLKGTSDGHTY